MATKGGANTPIHIKASDISLRLADGSGVDLVSYEGVLAIIENRHYQIHQGNNYVVADIDEDVDIAGPKEWLYIAPATGTKAHGFLTIKSTKNGKVEVFEDATTSDDGTELTIGNSNRTSSNVSVSQAFYDPTVTDDGNRMFVEVMGDDSTSGKGSGGSFHPEYEIITNNSKKYLIRFTSNSDNNRVSILMNWYEEAD